MIEHHKVRTCTIKQIKCVLLGCLVQFKTWFDLVEPVLDSSVDYGHLRVLSGLIEGSPPEYIADHIEELCRLLVDDTVCCSATVSFLI